MTALAGEKRVLAQFKNDQGDLVGKPFDLPLTIDERSLLLLCNAVLKNEEDTPYEFFVQDVNVKGTLDETLAKLKDVVTEKVLEITYQPQALFRVHPVTRCSSSIPGHTEAVIAVRFSPDGRCLASGSGDTTVRFWDISTETPLHTCEAHNHWILSIAWSPDGKKLASGCKNGRVCVWDSSSGKQIGHTLVGHKQWITWLSWQPLHDNPECTLLASASKDGTVNIWDVRLGRRVLSLCGHTHCVTCIRWGGEGLIYTSSQDRTVRVWRASDGVLCRTLQGHAHWVNILALSTDYILRTGAFEPADTALRYSGVDGLSVDELKKRALNRYTAAKGNQPERLASGSDDFTLFLWEPEKSKSPIVRMTGHQQLINDVSFSPDARYIASASFDKSVKLWDGRSGKYIASLRGHVSAVYQIAWSADSRLLCSGSSDSTLKVWEIKTRKLMMDLPGHADEVFTVDWSPDGEKVASGGRDRVMKLWRR